MNDLDRINLDHIERTYFSKGSAAQRGRDLIRRKASKRKYLKSLLRHHEEGTIGNKETWLRDYIDYLIAFYSMTEVACITGFLPSRLPARHRRQASLELGNPAVRAYYEDHYPLILPRLHLERCLHPAGKSVRVKGNPTPAFERFFALTRPIEFGTEVETFLWFLDGGWRGGYDIDDTIKAIGQPRRFLRCVSTPPEKTDDLDKSVLGFTIFLAFCRELNELLKDTTHWPLIQSAMWHYHGYWFDLMRDHFGTQLRVALSQFERWERKTGATSKEDHEILRESREDRFTLEMVIAALTSGRYGWQLREFSLMPKNGFASPA